LFPGSPPLLLPLPYCSPFPLLFHLLNFECLRKDPPEQVLVGRRCTGRRHPGRILVGRRRPKKGSDGKTTPQKAFGEKKMLQTLKPCY